MGTWMKSVFHRSALYRALYRLRLSTLVGRRPRRLTVCRAPGVVCLPDRESSRVAQADSSFVDSGEEEKGKVRFGSNGKGERGSDSGAEEGGSGVATVTERKESVDGDDYDEQQLAEGSEGGKGDHGESEEVQVDELKESG
ncbi:hypothetical protein FOZ62_020390, partial [Perkinsus olseni]